MKPQPEVKAPEQEAAPERIWICRKDDWWSVVGLHTESDIEYRRADLAHPEAAQGPCSACGDGDTAMKYHDHDAALAAHPEHAPVSDYSVVAKEIVDELVVLPDVDIGLGTPECKCRVEAEAIISSRIASLVSEAVREHDEDERIRIVAYLSYDTVYSDEFCVRCSHCPSNCECVSPVYMVGWQPDDKLKALKVALFQEENAAVRELKAENERLTNATPFSHEQHHELCLGVLARCYPHVNPELQQAIREGVESAALIGVPVSTKNLERGGPIFSGGNA